MRYRYPLPLAMVAALAVLALHSPACTSSQAFLATGETLIDLGLTFDATGRLMDAALDAKTITPAQYRLWAAFAKRFKLIYVPVGDLWRAAIQANDATGIQSANAEVASLAAELSTFTALATKGAAP